jgi:energy-converting hydrogenase Eha subunit E
MDKLMGGSPVVNRSALANSQTQLDLTSLDTEKATVGVSISFLLFALIHFLEASSKG